MFQRIMQLSLIIILPLFVAAASTVALPMYASAVTVTPCGSTTNGNTQYTPSIDIGCKNKGNPIMDAAFGIIRFLSNGVGIVIVASMVWAGIQYTTSRGDPNASALAMKRIQANVIALLIFIFAYAILNYIVPGALLTS